MKYLILASQSEGLGVAFFATGHDLGHIMYILTTLEFPTHNIDFHVIYQTRGRVFHQVIQTPRSVWITWWNTLPSVWYSISNKSVFKEKIEMKFGLILCKCFITYPNSVSVLISFAFLSWIINEFEIYVFRMCFSALSHSCGCFIRCTSISPSILNYLTLANYSCLLYVSLVYFRS